MGQQDWASILAVDSPCQMARRDCPMQPGFVPNDERWNYLTEEEQASFAPICPDFVIELKSASDSLTKLKEKMQEYCDNGAVLGWLIDLKNRTVHIYRPGQSPQVLKNPDHVSGDPELPGFSTPMAKIW